MDNYEKNKALSCVYNIYDKLDSIKHELSLENPNKGYLEEKIKPALHDINVLDNIIENID